MDLAQDAGSTRQSEHDEFGIPGHRIVLATGRHASYRGVGNEPTVDDPASPFDGPIWLTVCGEEADWEKKIALPPRTFTLILQPSPLASWGRQA